MFSVVVPLFNKEDFVGRAVDSVLAQDFKKFELIVVDDGSEDRSVDLVLERRDPRMRVIRQENAGVGAARNAGIRAATMPWVALLDADDYWFPGHLMELEKLASRFPDAGMIATTPLEGPNDHACPPTQRPPRRREIAYFERWPKEHRLVHTSGAALKVDVVRRVGEFRSFRRGQDQEYWARMALEAPVAKSNQVTYYYFHNSQSVSASLIRELPERRIEVLYPSVGFLRSIDVSKFDSALKSEILKYERWAIYSSILGALHRNEVGVARHLSRELRDHAADKAEVLRFFLMLPRKAVRAVTELYRLYRRFKRSPRFRQGYYTQQVGK